MHDVQAVSERLELGLTEEGKRLLGPHETAFVVWSQIAIRVQMLTVAGVPLADVLDEVAQFAQTYADASHRSHRGKWRRGTLETKRWRIHAAVLRALTE